MRVGVDMDGVICDLHTAWIDRYNTMYADCLTRESITDWDMTKFVKPECGARIHSLLTPDLYDDVRPIAGAIEGFRTLGDMAEAYIVTSSSPELAPAKFAWLRRWLPSFDRTRFIITPHKHLLRLDALVDDDPATCARVSQTETRAIMFEAPWNSRAKLTGVCRIQSWKDLPQVLRLS